MKLHIVDWICWVLIYNLWNYKNIIKLSTVLSLISYVYEEVSVEYLTLNKDKLYREILYKEGLYEKRLYREKVYKRDNIIKQLHEKKLCNGKKIYKEKLYR